MTPIEVLDGGVDERSQMNDTGVGDAVHPAERGSTSVDHGDDRYSSLTSTRQAAAHNRFWWPAASAASPSMSAHGTWRPSSRRSPGNRQTDFRRRLTIATLPARSGWLAYCGRQRAGFSDSPQRDGPNPGTSSESPGSRPPPKIARIHVTASEHDIGRRIAPGEQAAPLWVGRTQIQDHAPRLSRILASAPFEFLAAAARRQAERRPSGARCGRAAAQAAPTAPTMTAKCSPRCRKRHEKPMTREAPAQVRRVAAVNQTWNRSAGDTLNSIETMASPCSTANYDRLGVVPSPDPDYRVNDLAERGGRPPFRQAGQVDGRLGGSPASPAPSACATGP